MCPARSSDAAAQIETSRDGFSRAFNYDPVHCGEAPAGLGIEEAAMWKWRRFSSVQLLFAHKDVQKSQCAS